MVDAVNIIDNKIILTVFNIGITLPVFKGEEYTKQNLLCAISKLLTFKKMIWVFEAKLRN